MIGESILGDPYGFKPREGLVEGFRMLGWVTGGTAMMAEAYRSRAEVSD